jgi:hypothetical protein
MNIITESISERLSRLALAVSESRADSLAIAHAMGCDDPTIIRLAAAKRLKRGAGIVLPTHRYENLSRGRGWCRKGNRDSAVWGERVSGGYRVTSDGRWVVGGNDGFSRKDEAVWNVLSVTLPGGIIWTIAN